MQTALLNILQPQVQSSEAKGNVAALQTEEVASGEFQQLLGELGKASHEEVQAKLETDADILEVKTNILEQGKNLKSPMGVDSQPKLEINSQLLEVENTKINSELAKSSNGNLERKGEPNNLLEKKAHLFQALSPIGVKGQQQVLKGNTGDLQTGDDFLKNIAATNKDHMISVENGVAKQTKVSNLQNYSKGRDLLDNHIIKSSASFSANESLFSESESVDGQPPKLQLVQNSETGMSWAQTEGGETESGGFKSSQSQQVVDLSSIKAENKTALIGKITQYIEQAKLQNTDNLDVLVKHDELGQFRVIVNKAPVANSIGQNMLDLQIQAVSDNGHKFFVDNEPELIKTLSDAGIKLSDMKVLKGSELSLASDSGSKSFNGNQSDSSAGTNQQNNSNQQKQSGNRESQRRQEMWEYYKEKASA